MSRRDNRIHMEPGRPADRIASRAAFTGMLFALALVLQWLESLLPPLPVPAPVKLGLSNVVVMYAIFFLRRREAVMLACLKGAFAAMVRGLLAGALSLGGGLLSVGVMLLFDRLFRWRISWLMLSVSGAAAHHLGQILVLMLVMPFGVAIGMLSILVPVGMATGAVSAFLLRAVLPALADLHRIPRRPDWD